MSDPASLERYCSSYYDRHGLYNDGFPCPTDKYCCQNTDGTKMCCSLNTLDRKLNSKHSNTLPSQTVSPLHSTLFNKLNKSPLDSSFKTTTSTQSNTFSSSWPFLVTNSTLLMSISIILGLLVIISIILLIFTFKRCLTKTNKLKKVPMQTNNSVSNSSSVSPYSRNSSSSCTNTTVTSSSPKTTDIIVCCEEDDEHQKILTIDPNSGNSTSSSSTINSNMRTNLMLSNRSSNLSDLVMHHRNTFNHHQYMNAISSGSSSTALLLNNNNNSGNTTHSSFSSGSNTNFNQLQQHLNFNDNDMQFDEQDEQDDRDFIVTTSSNLDFLKSQSLFNSTPLNYYPTLPISANVKPIQSECSNQLTFNELPSPPLPTNNNSNTPVNTQLTNTTTTSQINLTMSTATPLGDYRFSTFLPTIYTKHHELI